MSVFQKSLPVLSTSFINKCGTIAISLLPMLLVQRKLASSDAALVLTLVKAALVGGTLFGGWICDRWGLKPAILLSFVIAGLGLCFMSVGESAVALCVFAVFGQLGQAMFRSPLRLMLTEIVPHEREQQEAIGWLRGANNLGQIVSYSLGSIFSSLGIPILIFFDGVTSLVAAVAGTKILPAIRPEHSPLRSHGDVPWKLFVMSAVILGGFMFLYELFIVTAAARCQLEYGSSGLKLFSTLMVVNTVLCSLFAVLASRLSRDPSFVLPFGIILVTAGACLFFVGGAHKWVLFSGMLVFTLGEILFTALAPFVVIRMLPTAKTRGSLYGGALVIESFGQLLAGAVAFPLVIHGKAPATIFLAAGAVVFVIFLFARPGINQFLSRHQKEEYPLDQLAI